MDRPRLDLQIMRFGAFGLLEAKEELLGVDDATVLEVVKRQLETMTPLDKAMVTINRCREAA